MYPETIDGKTGYKIQSVKDAVECVTILQTRVDWEEILDDSHYLYACNGLARWLAAMMEREET